MRQSVYILITSLSLLISFNANAQILKKLKNKIDKTIDKSFEKENQKAISKETTTSNSCNDNISLKDYKLIHQGNDKTIIFYDESSISLNSSNSSYKLVLKEGTGKNSIYTVIENDKIIYTGKTLPDNWVKSSKLSERLSKYIKIDSAKNTIKGLDATSFKTSDKININDLNQGVELVKQTDEYKAMSAEEKTEFDEFMKTQAPEAINNYNNSGVANKTFSTEKINSISFNSSEYLLIIRGKNYLQKNDFVSEFYVSEDENNVYIHGIETLNNKTFFQVNNKRYYPEINSNIITTQLLISKDEKKASLVSISTIAENQIENVYVKNAATNAYILNSDGLKSTINLNLENFMLTNEGKIISLNKITGEVLIHGKSIGRFPKTQDEYHIKSLLVGGETDNKIGIYDTVGNIVLLDGTTKSIGAIFPIVSFEKGNHFIKWFLQCENNIYIAQTEL